MKARPLFLFALLTAAPALAGTADVPMGFVPPATVTAALRKTLSPQGRFVILNATGKVRVVDTEEKIAEFYRVLDGLQKAPSLVALNIGFVVHGQKVVEHRAESGSGDAFPFPRNFSPPKIVQNRNGGTIVIPTQPSNFQGRGTGSSVGAATVTTTTEPTKQVIRRLTASSVPEKAAPVPVMARVEDPAGLRALAVKLGAIKDSEPAWPAASTELLIRTSLVGAELQVTITPQIALPPAAPGQEPRRIPLSACAAVIPITRAAPAPTGKLPRTDGEFYHLFMGAPVGGPDDITALSLTGDVRYVGTAVP